MRKSEQRAFEKFPETSPIRTANVTETDRYRWAYIQGYEQAEMDKNEEIYNIFDTEKFLKRPPVSAVSNTSGLAGIAHWINVHYKLREGHALSKTSPLVTNIKAWVDQEYAAGRVTVMTDGELVREIEKVSKELGIIVKEGEIVSRKAKEG